MSQTSPTGSCANYLLSLGRRAVTVALALLGFSATPATAVSTAYTYTGNPYTTIAVPSSGYTTANSVTTTLIFANALPANQTLGLGAGGFTGTITETLAAFAITDGTLTFDLSDTFSIFLETGNQGQVVSWFVGGCAAPCSSTININTQFGIPPPFNTNGLDASVAFSGGPLLAFVDNNPGTWTAPAPIPEPATLLLFGTTAAGMGLAAWRRRRQSH